MVKVVQSVECSTLTTRAWPTPLTGGSTADGMISRTRKLRCEASVPCHLGVNQNQLPRV